MVIKINHLAEGFTAVITGTDGFTVAWETKEPLSELELIEALRNEGEDQRDVLWCFMQVIPGISVLEKHNFSGIAT